MQSQCCYAACMPSITVRSVPDDVHDDLVKLAEKAGVSLTQFLNQQFAVLARLAHVDEAFTRLDNLAGVRPTVVEIVEELRHSRER